MATDSLGDRRTDAVQTYDSPPLPTDGRPRINESNNQPSLGELFSALTTDLTELVRGELLLARTEVKENVAQAARAAILLVAGGLLAYAGLITLIIAAVLGLATQMSAWIAALIVGVVVLIIGGVLALIGRGQLSSATVVPERTVESIQEDVDMVKEKVS